MVSQSGTYNESHDASSSGLDVASRIYWNNTSSELFEYSLSRGEGIRSTGDALSVTTGKHTGRSARDKFLVRDSESESLIWWNNNASMSPKTFATLHSDFLDCASGKELFAQDLVVGADSSCSLRVRCYTQFAWHGLFARHLLRRPSRDELPDFVPDLTVIDLPDFRADPTRHNCRTETIIAVDLTRRIILVGGTNYAGEIKKSVFGVMNYILPQRGILPMHCSANSDSSGDTALFFGLSGTGKTTLSSDSSRRLIGDDEHGWSDSGIFNFEGGCYAKTLGLTSATEPEIYAATCRPHSVLENVLVDESGAPDFFDSSLTENGRVAYPLDYIDNIVPDSTGGHPRNIVMLTADAYAVLPPIARLSADQAIYYFLSGYTAKVAGTEKGVEGAQATFSTCFGAPFMPLHACVYGDLLRHRIATHATRCWLINTGWTGGPYGEGNRMPLSATRKLLRSALDGSLDSVPTRPIPLFGLEVPISVDGVDDSLLDPRSTWSDPIAYDRAAANLAHQFVDNFTHFESHVGSSILSTAPKVA